MANIEESLTDFLKHIDSPEGYKSPLAIDGKLKFNFVFNNNDVEAAFMPNRTAHVFWEFGVIVRGNDKVHMEENIVLHHLTKEFIDDGKVVVDCRLVCPFKKFKDSQATIIFTSSILSGRNYPVLIKKKTLMALCKIASR